MKKLLFQNLFIIFFGMLSITFAFAIEYNLNSGETINGIRYVPVSFDDLVSYSDEIIGKPSFISYHTTEVLLSTSLIITQVEIKYSIEAEASSPAGVYDFTVWYTLYDEIETPLEFIPLSFTVGIDVPDISVSPSNYIAYSVTASFNSLATSPEDLAFDGQYLWCVDNGSDEIHKIDTSGNLVTSIESPTDSPGGLTFDGMHLWTTDYTDEKIYKLDTAGNILDSFDSPGSHPEGLAFDGTYLWNADSSDDKIFKFDTTGNVINSFDSPGSSPMGLAFDGKYLWNIDSFKEKIYVLDVNGNVLESFDTPGDSPKGLTFQGEYLWYADSYGTSGETQISKLEMPAVGIAVRQLFTVENKGVVDLLIGAVSTAGKNALELNVEANGCSQQSVAPSQSCSFEVVFVPVNEGKKAASIEIASNDPDEPVFTIPLDVTVGDFYRQTAMPWIHLLLIDD
jgi:DNA-binding beta-propeller fold protein YncE